MDEIDSVPVTISDLDRNPLPAEYVRTEEGKLLYCSVYKDRLRTPGLDVDNCFKGHITITEFA